MDLLASSAQEIPRTPLAVEGANCEEYGASICLRDRILRWISLESCIVRPNVNIFEVHSDDTSCIKLDWVLICHPGVDPQTNCY